MANLLNVVPQANNVSSSLSAKNPAKKDEKDLKKLFDEKLSEKLDTDNTDEKLVDPNADLAKVALASGSISAQKAAPIDLKNVEIAEKTLKDVKNPKVAELVAQKMQIVDPKLIAAKNLNPAELAEMMKKANALAKNGVIQGEANQVDHAELASMMAQQGLVALPDEHDFDVESLEVLPKEAPSKLSTSDFLNLREISQSPAKSNLLTAVQSPALTDAAKLVPLQVNGAVVGMKPTQKQKTDEKQNFETLMSGLSPAHSEKQVFGKTLDASVSQVSGQKPVLSQQSLSQISNEVNLLGQARQDGEIKIRLRPDHLGELQMSIRTQGQNVSVQIRAQNNEAKKIIEDSLGALREHLSLQNLSLARIDVVTQPTTASSLDQTQMNFDANQNFNQSSAHEGGYGQSQDGSQQSRREFYREDPLYASAKPAMMRSKMADSTRLDLIA